MGSPQNVASPQKESRFDFNFSPARTFRNARQSLLPSYHSSSPARAQPSRSSSTYSRSTSGESRKWWNSRKRPDSEIPDMPINISAPLNVNPNFAHLVRPNLAHHPSQRRADNDAALKDLDFK
jgi:hypothetical protein